jgi:hypothetical protein
MAHTLTRRRATVVAWFFLAVLPAVVPNALAHTEHPPGEFVIETVYDGLNQPTVVAFADDGRVFVGEKSGRIHVFDGLDDTDGPDTITELPPRVHDYLDRGLLGLAAHPDFAANPYLYTLYTWDRKIPAQGSGSWGDTCPFTDDPGCVVDGRLSRFPLGPDNLPSGPEQVLIEDRWCQRAPATPSVPSPSGRTGPSTPAPVTAPRRSPRTSVRSAAACAVTPSWRGVRCAPRMCSPTPTRSASTAR